MNLRQATPADAEALCGVINPIIARGGTTAYAEPFTLQSVLDEFVTTPDHIACTLAESSEGAQGFQALLWGQAHDDLPEGWAVIGTYARIDRAGTGIGRALFEETKRLARASGATVIDATIRSYNAGGLAYYSRMGFVDWKVTPEAVSKRYDL